MCAAMGESLNKLGGDSSDEAVALVRVREKVLAHLKLKTLMTGSQNINKDTRYESPANRERVGGC